MGQEKREGVVTILLEGGRGGSLNCIVKTTFPSPGLL